MRYMGCFHLCHQLGSPFSGRQGLQERQLYLVLLQQAQKQGEGRSMERLPKHHNSLVCISGYLWLLALQQQKARAVLQGVRDIFGKYLQAIQLGGRFAGNGCRGH